MARFGFSSDWRLCNTCGIRRRALSCFQDATTARLIAIGELPAHFPFALSPSDSASVSFFLAGCSAFWREIAQQPQFDFDGLLLRAHPRPAVPMTAEFRHPPESID